MKKQGSGPVLFFSVRFDKQYGPKNINNPADSFNPDLISRSSFVVFFYKNRRIVAAGLKGPGN